MFSLIIKSFRFFPYHDTCRKVFARFFQVLFPYGTSRREIFQQIRLAANKNYLRHLITLPRTYPLEPIQNEGTKAVTRILIVENCVPDPLLGAGYPRSLRLLETLASIENTSVTFYPLSQIPSSITVINKLESLGIEMICKKDLYRVPSLETLLKKRTNYYTDIILCRPYIMSALWPMMRRLSPGSRIIYDAEAIFSLREIAYYTLKNQPISRAKSESLIKREVSLAQHADATLCVSKFERDYFSRFGIHGIQIVNHIVPSPASIAPPQSRRGLLFVGPLHGDSPNEDALIYFIREILPIIKRSASISFTVVGSLSSKRLLTVSGTDVIFTGSVPDLANLYNSARVFVAPTRYAAGIPIKVLEATGNGIPCVITPVLADQLNWINGNEALVGDTPQSFADCCLSLLFDDKLWERVSTAGQQHILTEYNKQLFAHNLRNALGLSANPHNGKMP